MCTGTYVIGSDTRCKFIPALGKGSESELPDGVELTLRKYILQLCSPNEWLGLGHATTSGLGHGQPMPDLPYSCYRFSWGAMPEADATR